MSERLSDCYSSSSEELFLDKDKIAPLKEEIDLVLGRPRRWRVKLSGCARIALIVFHLGFFVLNIVWSVANVRYQRAAFPTQGNMYGQEPSDAPYSEKYTRYDLPLGVKSRFTTFDRAVADEAWTSISMKQGLGWIKIPQDKVDEMGQTSVQFDDRSGYFFGMDVFHQLHCLNYLRKKSVLYTHLYPSDDEDEQVPPEFHIPHCIDSIRLSLQCHADLSLVPQRWADGWLEPWAVWTNRHVCRNFDDIRDWAQARVPKLAGTLRHPELGTVVSGRLNLSALPLWGEAHDPDVKPGHMPVCHA